MSFNIQVKKKFKYYSTQRYFNNFSSKKFLYLDDGQSEMFVLVDSKNSSLKYISNFFGLKANQKTGTLSIGNDGLLEYSLVGYE